RPDRRKTLRSHVHRSAQCGRRPVKTIRTAVFPPVLSSVTPPLPCFQSTLYLYYSHEKSRMRYCVLMLPCDASILSPTPHTVFMSGREKPWSSLSRRE